MKPISLDDLPHFSPWPARLLANEARAPRNSAGVRREYRAKYARLLQLVDEDPRLDLEAVRGLELGGGKTVMSYGDRLAVASLAFAMGSSVTRFLDGLRAAGLNRTESLLDLGSGYGYVLHRVRGRWPHLRIRGGELTPEGVRLAGALDASLRVEAFDFLSGRCSMLSPAEPVTVITSYSLHQLPTARIAVEMLSRDREAIERVVCWEPEEDDFGDGLLGLLRRRYGEFCGYSADLRRVLADRDDIEVEHVQRNVMGANALLPASLTIWRFR